MARKIRYQLTVTYTVEKNEEYTPTVENETSLFEGLQESEYFKFDTKIENITVMRVR